MLKFIYEVAQGFLITWAMTALCLPGLSLLTSAMGYPETAYVMLQVGASLVFVNV